MFNIFNTSAETITQQALTTNFSVEEERRRKAATLNKDFYYGNQEQTLVLVNEDVDPVTLNLTNPIVKKRASLLYKKPVVRHFDGPEESIEFLEQVYRENDMSSFMLSVDLAAELTGSALVHPSLDESRPSGVKLWLYDASAVSVVSGDVSDNNPDAVSVISVVESLNTKNGIKNATVERNVLQQIWTDTSVTLYNGNQVADSETHDLGFVPFVNFKGEEVYDQYLGHAPTTPIRQLNAQINQLLTSLGYMIKMQAATPIALIGYESGEGVTIHPGKAFSLPVGASAQVLNLNPKLTEVLDTIKFLETKLFETSSVPRVSIVGGEGESGKELMIRWYPLLQIFEEKTTRFQKYELQLANMILDMVGLERVDSVNISFDYDAILPVSDKDETLDGDIALNLKTPIDELLRRDPSLSEEEAYAIILANREINENLLKANSDDKLSKSSDSDESKGLGQDLPDNNDDQEEEGD